MIPAWYDSDEPCFVTSHKRRHSRRECYRETWQEPPFPWVKRPGPPTFYSDTGGRLWHYSPYGIRRDTGHAEPSCNTRSGPGPFLWRAAPPDRETERERACQKCLSRWMEDEVVNTTVRGTPLRVRKGQLAQLLQEIGGTDLMEVELRPTAVENEPALIAEWSEHGPKNDKTVHKVLLIGAGIVKVA